MTSEKTDINTTIFWSEAYGIPPMEFDCISHFYEEADWYRIEDVWGKTGWVIGFRDVVDTTQKGLHGQKRTSSFGGQLWIFYDHDHSIGGIEPDKAYRL